MNTTTGTDVNAFRLGNTSVGYDDFIAKYPAFKTLTEAAAYYNTTIDNIWHAVNFCKDVLHKGLTLLPY